MRFLSFLVLVVLVGGIVLFALQNQQEITLRLWDRELSTTLPIFTGAIYLLGMITGWSVIGLLRRSLAKVTEPPDRR